jgi:pimeloyl-ACP methyl ester carboxylesterase
LVKGRERIYFEHFWNDFAADGTKSVSEADRRFYAQKYAQPGAMKAGMEVFRNFDQDAKDNAVFAATKLTMPVLVLGGEKSGGEFPHRPGQDGRDQCRRRARDGLGALAHRRGTRAGHSKAGGVLRTLEAWLLIAGHSPC